MPEHNTLVGSNAHEPKGAETLTAGAVDVGKAYLSDGAGSGTWALPSTSAENAALSLGKTVNNALATTVLVLDTYYAVAGTWTQEVANVMTTVLATGTINVVTDGDYEAEVDISMISSRSNAVAAFRFMVNGVATGPRIRRKIGTGADVGAVPLHAVLPGLVSGDTVQLACTLPSGEGGIAGDTITVENSSFIVSLVTAT